MQQPAPGRRALRWRTSGRGALGCRMSGRRMSGRRASGRRMSGRRMSGRRMSGRRMLGRRMLGHRALRWALEMWAVGWATGPGPRTRWPARPTACARIRPPRRDGPPRAAPRPARCCVPDPGRGPPAARRPCRPGGDQRNPGRSAGQQHRPQRGRLHPGRPQRPAQGADRVGQRRPDHRLELGAGEADPGVQAGQRHRDHHLGVLGEGLLGLDAVAAQPGQGGAHVRVVRGQRRRHRAHGVQHVLEDRLVEVDAAELLDAFRFAEQLEPVGRAAQHRRVEGAAAQVVDGDDLAGRRPARRPRTAPPRPPARCAVRRRRGRPGGWPGPAGRACTDPSSPGRSPPRPPVASPPRRWPRAARVRAAGPATRAPSTATRRPAAAPGRRPAA